MKAIKRNLFVFAMIAVAASSQAVMGNLLSAAAPWDNVGMVLTSGGSGSGVPISSRWVLTAGHVVRSGSGTITGTGTTNFRLGSLSSGTNYAIDQIIPHATDDVALIRTTTNLPGWYGMNLNTVANQTQFDIVGFGITGTYNAGTWTTTGGSYGTRRRGQNVVSNTFNVGQNSGFNRWTQVYRYDFDGDGVDFFNDGGPVSGGDALGLSGDSGGGIFENGNVFALHVGRFGGSGGGTQFGTIGVGIRLSHYSDFIRTTTGVPEPGTVAAVAFGIGALAVRRRKRSKK
ncbi:MAG: trypsin-like serine protease [Fimbriimonadaceae bacterium]|nr:trypsin-like serine protease [Fimbriimonadaceae bacterium]